MLTRNVLGGIVATLIGVVYLYFASHLRSSALADSFGPRGMPLVYGWLTTGLGLILLGQALIEVFRMTPEARWEHLGAEWSGEGIKIARAAGLFVIAFVYVGALPYLGYPLAMLLLIGVVAIYMGAVVNLRLAVIAGGGAAVLWLIFVVLLDVHMPMGIFALAGR